AAGQSGAADGGHVARGRGVRDAVAVVARARGDGDARVVEVDVLRRLGARLVAAVAVADRVRAERGRGVDGGVEIGVEVRVRLDQQDVAVRADGADHVEVERDLEPPVGAR